MLIGRVLRREGFDTVEAADGADAIARLEEGRRFDAVVLDLMMPRVDGFGVVEHLIATDPRMLEKVVVTTAYPKAAAKERLHHLCTIMTKPFDVAELVKHVRICAAR